MLGTTYRGFREGWKQSKHRVQPCMLATPRRWISTSASHDGSGGQTGRPSELDKGLSKYRLDTDKHVGVFRPPLRQSGCRNHRGFGGDFEYSHDLVPGLLPPISSTSIEDSDGKHHQKETCAKGSAFKVPNFEPQGPLILTPRQEKLLKIAVVAAHQRMLRNQFQKQPERCFSSSSDKDEENETIKSLSSSYIGIAAEKPRPSSSAAPVVDVTILKETDKYVNPESAVSSEAPRLEDAIKPKIKYRKSKRMLVPNYGPDADQALRSLQDARKEKANAKTEANVRRALYGNLLICAAKLGAWISSGSSSMMSEFVHSVVDCGNQSLLLMGLRDSRNAADRHHPYGYGKSVYFWALVSALGTFFLGAGVSMSHSIRELMDPSLQEISWEVWSVLGMSFAIDGYVLYKTFSEIREGMPQGASFWKHVWNIRDPATLAVLLEDGAACLGVVIAIAGITAAHATGNPMFDGMAGVGISCLLGSMGLVLVRVNHRFLLGQGVDREMIERIEKIILSRGSIDNVYSIQSQWTGPETFSFKAEVDFDGTFLAAQLMPRYEGEFRQAQSNLEDELEVLLCWYAEDVMRAVEREVRFIEAQIRNVYPGAEYIELEPMSRDADKFAIDDSFEEKLQMIEKEEVKSMIRVLYQNDPSKGMPDLDNIDFGIPKSSSNDGTSRPSRDSNSK